MNNIDTSYIKVTRKPAKVIARLKIMKFSGRRVCVLNRCKKIRHPRPFSQISQRGSTMWHSAVTLRYSNKAVTALIIYIENPVFPPCSQGRA